MDKYELSLFEKLSQERKELQANGDLPDWFTTMGWQMFRDKYLYQASTYEEQIDRVVNVMSKHCSDKTEYFKYRWKELLMRNHAYLATPVLANAGTTRGNIVSCQGSYVPDSIDGFYSTLHEQALLTKYGFGVSAYFGAISERGVDLDEGMKASGTLPVFKQFVQMSKEVSQGSRRGAFAGYLPLEHGDFWEVVNYLKNNPDSMNVGWNIYDTTIEKLENGSKDLNERFAKSLHTKLLQGKGYYYFPDKVGRAAPQMYKDLGLSSKASNLCTEITLHSDEQHTYSCVLSGMVATTWEEWKDTDAVFCMTVFLDCMVSEFLSLVKGKKGLEKIIRGTEKGRAIGLGLTGLHSLFQMKRLPFGSLEAHWLNDDIFKHLHDESLKASEWMATKWGEPEWCEGYGVRNTHRTALAPNVSSALIFGSQSQGITPWYGNCFNEESAAGGMFRVNPVFIGMLKDKGKYSDKVLRHVHSSAGSAQDLDFLTDEEKDVMLTAFEINQRDLLRLAGARQKYICQSQSLNLFFAEDEQEEYIAEIHKEAFLDESIHSLYYLRGKAGVEASKGECTACQS